MYPGVELRLLRYVVVVSEELHFRHAAERLHVSQPSLSKQILQLEAFLGFKLFRRTKQSVELTPAGHRFVAEARKALHYSDRAVEAGKKADREEQEPWIVGYCSYVDLHLLSALRRMRPVSSAETIYRSSSTTEIARKLLSHEWQAGLVILPLMEAGLAVRPLSREPAAIALPSSHSLAKRSEIALPELLEERLILPQRRVNPHLYDFLTTQFRAAGLTLGITEEVVNPHEALHLVSDALGVAVVQSSASHSHMENVAIVGLAQPNLTMETGIAWNPENTSDHLRLFLDAVVHTLDGYIRRQERKPPKSA